MKKLLNTHYDTIIEAELHVKTEGKVPLKNKDGLFIHEGSICKIYMYFPKYDANGMLLSNTKVVFTKQDIEKMYNEIKEIESTEYHLESIQKSLPF